MLYRRGSGWWTVAALAVALSGCSSSGSGTTTPGSPGSSATTAGSPVSAPAVRTLVGHLPVPWDITFLPDRTALMTLRDKGEVLAVSADGRSTRSLGTVTGVVADGEGGLLGLAPSPTYTTDHAVYLYYTAAGDNRIVRATVENGRLSAFHVVLSGIPKNTFHNGGRLAFGPDGYLYAGTGDAGAGTASQDRTSLGGKILRITADGRPAPGNPFGNAVWTYGHRNVQGLAWTKDGTMYASEFGQNTWDELNRIEKGRDYGWPVVEGMSKDARYANPLAVWHTADASPSGIAIGPDGAVWMAALAGRSLWRIPVDGGSVGTPQRLLEGTYGRLRDVALAPDGRLWVLTSNTFRGTPAPDDDRLLEVTPVGSTS